MRRAIAFIMALAQQPAKRQRTSTEGEAEEEAAASMTAAEACEAAASEGLTLVQANTASGFKGVVRSHGRFAVHVWEAGRIHRLGNFATAEQGALCYARHIGKEAAETAAAAAAVSAAVAAGSMTAAEACEAAASEGLTLVPANTASGFKGVTLKGGRFAVHVWEAGRVHRLGNFATAEQGALCYARRIGKEAAETAAAAAAAAADAVAAVAAASSITAKEACEAAALKEGLTLERADIPSGFKCVYKNNGRFSAVVKGKKYGQKANCTNYLGCFTTAEEAALCYARHKAATEAAAVMARMTAKM